MGRSDAQGGACPPQPVVKANEQTLQTPRAELREKRQPAPARNLERGTVIRGRPQRGTAGAVQRRDEHGDAAQNDPFSVVP